MAIRVGTQENLEHLVALFKQFFPVHNQFQQPDRDIVDYLHEQLQDNELLVSETKGIYDGALFLVKIGESSDSTHKIRKFRHFAFTTESIGKELLQEAEKSVQAQSPTSKIELTIAETEPGKDFYLKHGYQQEATLPHHYRWGETCFILGKSFS